MTILEQLLAGILSSIEDARASGNSLALAALLLRKDAICAALAAPEQSWLAPSTQSSSPATQRKAA